MTSVRLGWLVFSSEAAHTCLTETVRSTIDVALSLLG
jgi:hypothetical protein